MKAAYIEQGKVGLRDLPEPIPGPGQALLAPILAGICNTDLELLAGYYDFRGVPGHEFVARVLSAPEAPELEGALVAAEINCGCGSCPRCAAGDPRHCPERRVIGIKDWPGAFAERLLAPVANLRAVPEGLALERAVFAEPLAAALEVSQQVHLTADMRVLVLGDGKLGLLCALALRVFCPRLLLAGRHPEKLAIAGAQGVDTIEAGEALESAGPFDLVVEATGSPEGAARAIELTRPEGTVVLKTTSHLPSRLDLSRVVVNEVCILGSRCGSLALALDRLARGGLAVEPLIEARYPLARIDEAMAHAARRGALKVLVEMP